MTGARRLVVNWQSPLGAIIPVAELLIARPPQRSFEFRYIEGVRDALALGFQPFTAFSDLALRYVGDRLFPFFRNRVMPTTRPDYPEYVAALGLDAVGGDIDVAEILGRGRSLRQTDRIETILAPERDTVTGRYVTRFLVRGVRHVPDAEAAAARLLSGDQLHAQLETDNVVNQSPRQLVSQYGVVGYLPDYLVVDLDALEAADANPTFTVERMNPPPLPAHPDPPGS